MPFINILKPPLYIVQFCRISVTFDCDGCPLLYLQVVFRINRYDFPQCSLWHFRNFLKHKFKGTFLWAVHLCSDDLTSLWLVALNTGNSDSALIKSWILTTSADMDQMCFQSACHLWLKWLADWLSEKLSVLFLAMLLLQIGTIFHTNIQGPKKILLTLVLFN